MSWDLVCEATSYIDNSVLINCKKTDIVNVVFVPRPKKIESGPPFVI